MARKSLPALLLLLALGPAWPYEPTSHYEIRQIEGWKVYVNKRLLDEEKDTGRKVLRLLETKLYDINRMVPEPALEHLHKVPIWMEFKDKDVACGCYHPSREWLTEHDFNPDKARCVEFGNAAHFLAWSKVQPSLVLHELAHAYHHQVLGWDNPEIIAAYKRAKKSGSYDAVLHYSSRTKRAYAMNNAKEYFAELSEAFFGTNDFYPFVRPEVKKHDPQMYELLKKLWGVK